MAKPNVSTLSAERARELLRYDPETGRLYWRNSARYGQILSGTEAGGLTVKGYRHVRIDGRLYAAHRVSWLIVTAKWPADQIDHINGDRLDNRWGNLREATNQVNARNQKRRIDNTSHIVGVIWYKPGNKWRAQIRVNGAHIHLGYFDDLAAAVEARKAAECRHGFHPNHGRTA